MLVSVKRCSSPSTVFPVSITCLRAYTKRVRKRCILQVAARRAARGCARLVALQVGQGPGHVPWA